jgi:hypothetical protein
LTVLLLIAPASAPALEYKDIAGTWCGETTNYTFERKSLRVFWQDDKTSRTFPVSEYEYDRDEITVHWRKDGETVFTVFSQFEGGNMVQKRNDNGPRREFRRC